MILIWASLGTSEDAASSLYESMDQHGLLGMKMECILAIIFNSNADSIMVRGTECPRNFWVLRLGQTVRHSETFERQVAFIRLPPRSDHRRISQRLHRSLQERRGEVKRLTYAKLCLLCAHIFSSSSWLLHLACDDATHRTVSTQ